VEFRILGPIEVVGDGGESLALGGSQSRALLAALLLEPGRAVTRERLIDGLWAAPPPTASHGLEVSVSRLRRTIGRSRIVCQGNAYRVQVDAAELDLTRFRTLVRSGRAAAASGALEDAATALTAGLGVWRGDALACLNGEPFARDARAFLQEERLSALETPIDVDLALGRHDELVSELRRLVAVHPTRERLWGRLMVALYRCGRQIDALEAFTRLRSRLRDELGLEPGPELRAVHRSILEHDPTLGRWSAARVRV
jgi:DNA-binding SARP family transcriptional activator